MFLKENSNSLEYNSQDLVIFTAFALLKFSDRGRFGAGANLKDISLSSEVIS